LRAQRKCLLQFEILFGERAIATRRTRYIRRFGIETVVGVFSEYVALEENLRPAIKTKAETLSEPGGLKFYDGPRGRE